MKPSEIIIRAHNVDLSNCDREQIQFSGAILPHGALLTASEPELTVLQASVNCSELLGISADGLRNKPLSTLFTDAQMDTLRERLARYKLDGAPFHLLRHRIGEADLDVFAHRNDGVLIMEFERRPPGERVTLELYTELRAAISRLQAAPTMQAFLDLAVEQVRDFTGFDRVMAYKFMEDGSGWVRSESLAHGEGFTPYLGLHYPASDIPEPARRLFSLTWLRHQPDIDYVPVPIVPASNPASGRALDMSYALLRSVSVMYTDYLKNMGTRASMVMTLLKDGKLWGLIACHHHRGPKHVPYEVRMACEFLAHMVSTLMSAKEDIESYEYRMRLRSTCNMLVENLAREEEFGGGLLRREPTLLNFVRARGAALVLNRRVEILGETPPPDKILRIADWLGSNMEQEVFATDSLSAHLREAEEYKDVGSGLLALRFAKVKNDYVLWFRPEQIQTVNWAGDPRKPVEVSEDGQRLMPRTSFELWKETVSMKADPWSELEIAAASDFRVAILELVLRKAEELGRLYEDLERSHSELDAFAYVASHDLKEPLRGIHNYAEILLDDYGDKLDEEGRGRLHALSRLTQRMDGLLDSLLEYSRVGRSDFADIEVDLNRVIAEQLESLQSRIESDRAQVRIPTPLPKVNGDRVRIGEIFLNLISNAIKYNDKPVKTVEIGFELPGPQQRPAFYVRDNGIGIREDHYDQIFQIFRRLHARDTFGGGAGAGLTIVKKIVERHGGRIWVDSAPGEGTTFWFTLGR